MSSGRFRQLFPILGVFIILALPGAQAAAINWPAVGSWALSWLRDLVFYLILGLLAIWLIPKPLNRWSEVARRSPVKSFGVGIVILVAGYAAMIILFVLLLALGIFFYSLQFSNLSGIAFGLGLPGTGLAFGVLNFIVAYASKLVVVFLLGKLILEGLYPKALKHNIWPLLAGLLVYLLLRAIPWLGWAIGSVVTLLGLGAIWLGLFTRPTAAGATVETPAPDEQAVMTAESEQVEEGGTNVQTSEAEPAEVQDQPVTNPVEPTSEMAPELGELVEGDTVEKNIVDDANDPKEQA